MKLIIAVAAIAIVASFTKADPLAWGMCQMGCHADYAACCDTANDIPATTGGE